MPPERWEQVERIFHSTLRLNPEERHTYLAKVCEADAVLLKEVESLISAFEAGNGEIEHPVFSLGLQLMTNEPDNLAAGIRIGSYEILDFLGRGGMGEVYLARDAVLCRNVALKLLPRSLTSDPIRILRFQREARAAAAISHPNVAHIYGTGVIDGRHYIAMEFVNGVTLRRRLNNGPVSVKEALHIALEIASALAAAHQQSIVHRDVKPENVMIRNDGLVKILDFGLAKLSEKVITESVIEGDPSSNRLTQTNPGIVMGTVRYMSPEQIRGQEVDDRTDIWSLGALLYEMIAARAPFEAATPQDEMALILQREPSQLSSKKGLVPSELCRIIEKALCKELDRRYQRMTDLVGDLQRLHSQVSVEGGSGGFIDRRSYTEVERATSTENRILLSAEHIIGEIKHHKKETFSVLAVFAFIAAFFFLQPDIQSGRREVAQPFHEMNITSLSNTGKAVLAVVSPDGAQVAQVEELRGQKILTVTHTQSGETRVVDQADDTLFKGLTFSNDGQRLYYIRYEHTNDGSLYQTALPDGPRTRLLNSVDSPISFAPDGGRFAFIRYNKTQGRYSLVIANAAGAGEHVVATKANGVELSIEGPAWSPDGKRILCAVGEWNNGHHMKLVTFDIENGKETLLAGPSWFSIGQVAWLADESEIVICAAKQAMSPYQLWRISYPAGEIKKITNDMADYYGVSLSTDSRRLISVQSNRVSQIWVASADDVGRAKAIFSRVGLSFGVAWTGDGKVVFSSMTGSNLNISVMNADGSQVKQLTMNSGDNYHPTLSADGRYIVFTSNRTGTFNIWRMNAHDGSEPTQLTFGDASSYPFCSPDNQWVFYDDQSEGKPSLWKVPLGGGEPLRVSEEYGRMPVISPDNRYIASRQFIGPEKLGITILPIQGGPPVKRLPIPIIEWQRVQWTPDSNSLTFINTIEGISNIWQYDLDDPRPKLLTDFRTDLIFSYAWSPDFRQLVAVRGNVISDVVAISDFSQRLPS